MWMEQHEAGKKATHDFLSLYTKDTAACPPNKGGGLSQLKTYNFLQPLDREEGSEEQAEPLGAHVLPGGIGTYSISHVAESGSGTVVKTEGGTCSDYAIAIRGGGDAYADPSAGVTFTSMWDQNPSPVTTKDRSAAAAAATATNGLRGQWPSPVAARSSGSSCRSLSSTRLQTGQQVQQGRKRSMDRPSGFDEDEDDEDFRGGRRVVSSQKGDLAVKIDGKGENVSDQRPSTPRSKHSATEQRRRSKINDRFQMLREIIPHNDQKRDKASFLLEVIEYIRFLQDKVHKYEEVCPGWTDKSARLMPWSNSQAPGDGIADPSQVIKNSSVPAGFTFPGNETGVPVAPAIHSSLPHQMESDVGPGVSYKTTGNPSGFASKMGVAPGPQPNLYASASRETGVTQLQPPVTDSDNMASQSLPQWLRPTCPAECTVPGDSNDQEELAIDEGTISVSSTYSQGLLTSLSRSLQSSGINLSQASISVQINLGKRATNERLTATSTMSSAKDHDDPSSCTRAIGYSRVGSTGEESGRASKRHKSDRS